jgi:hypothetical protein
MKKTENGSSLDGQVAKTFKVPKYFTEQWLIALRSGKYDQGIGKLKDDDDCYCCLGVACTLADIDNELLLDKETPYDLEINEGDGVLGDLPSILIGSISSELDLADLLMQLNDGIPKESYERALVKYPNLILDKINIPQQRFSFKQIADFIEANCDFV